MDLKTKGPTESIRDLHKSRFGPGVVEIVKPGAGAVVMFRAVQRRVRTAIGQEPYLGFNAMGDVYLAGTEAPKPQAAREWERVERPLRAICGRRMVLICRNGRRGAAYVNKILRGPSG